MVLLDLRTTYARSKAVYPNRINPSHVNTNSRLLLQIRPMVAG